LLTRQKSLFGSDVGEELIVRIKVSNSVVAEELNFFDFVTDVLCCFLRVLDLINLQG